MAAKERLGFQPDYAIPPGETIREVMQTLGMNQKDMAQRLELTIQSLIRIIKGEQPITYETAGRLELVTGTPASFWNNLEAQYREQLAKEEERNRLAEDLDWLKTIPVAELVARGVIPKTKDRVAQLWHVLRFYGVSSVEAWNVVWEEPAVAARRSPCFESRPGSASVWIRLGELQAQAIECAPYDKERFRQVLKELRVLTREAPEVFVPRMIATCSAAGVAIALVPEMKKVPWSGATKWLTPSKAMILLNLRGKAEDKFWFSFFHEAGHVLHDQKKDLYINDGCRDDPREVRADAFAAETLIPQQYNDRIRAVRSREELKAMAEDLGISPGILAGRYQYLTGKWQFFKDAIVKLQWTAD